VKVEYIPVSIDRPQGRGGEQTQARLNQASGNDLSLACFSDAPLLYSPFSEHILHFPCCFFVNIKMGGCLSASNVPVEEPAPALSRADTSKYDSQLDDIKADILADGNLPMTVVRMHSHMETPIEEIYAGVHDGPVLGDGVSGIVRKVKHRSTGVEYAVKRLDLSLVKQGHEGLNALREEIVITCQMDHPNVVRLEEAYESDTEIYLIQQLCSGGDLFDRLKKQPDIHYTEAKCAKLVEQMLKALCYLHSKGIIHR
jgi:hypothetical protein